MRDEATFATLLPDLRCLALARALLVVRQESPNGGGLMDDLPAMVCLAGNCQACGMHRCAKACPSCSEADQRVKP